MNTVAVVKRFWLVVLIAILLLVGVLLSYLEKVSRERFSPALPTSAFWLPQGKQTYHIVQAKDAWPKITQATIDPVDVHVGDTQTLSVVVVEDPDAIESVTALIETDKGTKTLTLSKGESHAAGPPGFYSGEWVVQDTHNTKYHTTFVAKDAKGRESSVTLAWSDACGIPKGGDWNLATDNNGSCTISSTDGVDNGNATVQTHTLTLNAPFAFNPGKSVNVVSGAIAIGSGGELKQTYLWQTDQDADSYPLNGTQYAQDSAPSNGRRRNLISETGLDCNDTDGSVYQNLTGYTDSDVDGYGVGTGSQVCSGSSLPAGYADNNTDCYDLNANAKPVVTGTYNVHRGDGSFDYDCNGQEWKLYQSFYTVQPLCEETSPGVCEDTRETPPQSYDNSVPACGQSNWMFVQCNWVSPGTCNAHFTNQQQYCR
jgi:hypothetical protein